MDALKDPQVLESLPVVLAALAVLGSIVGGAIGLTIRFLVFSDKRMERMVVSAFSSKPFVEAVERISVAFTSEVKVMIADLRKRDEERADSVKRAHQRIDELATETSKQIVDVYKQLGRAP